MKAKKLIIFSLILVTFTPSFVITAQQTHAPDWTQTQPYLQQGVVCAVGESPDILMQNRAMNLALADAVQGILNKVSREFITVYDQAAESVTQASETTLTLYKDRIVERILSMNVLAYANIIKTEIQSDNKLWVLAGIAADDIIAVLSEEMTSLERELFFLQSPAAPQSASVQTPTTGAEIGAAEDSQLSEQPVEEEAPELAADQAPDQGGWAAGLREEVMEMLLQNLFLTEQDQL